MAKIKNNRDVFAERGEPWEAPGWYLRPGVTCPQTGRLKTTREETVRKLTQHIRDKHAPKRTEHQPSQFIELDAYLLAGRAQPFAERILRERNKLIPGMPNRPEQHKTAIHAILNFKAKQRRG